MNKTLKTKIKNLDKGLIFVMRDHQLAVEPAYYSFKQSIYLSGGCTATALVDENKKMIESLLVSSAGRCQHQIAPLGLSCIAQYRHPKPMIVCQIFCFYYSYAFCIIRPIWIGHFFKFYSYILIYFVSCCLEPQFIVKILFK